MLCVSAVPSILLAFLCGSCSVAVKEPKLSCHTGYIGFGVWGYHNGYMGYIGFRV